MRTNLLKSSLLVAGFLGLTACPGKSNNNNNNANQVVPQGRISAANNPMATCDVGNGYFTCNGVDQFGRMCPSTQMTFNPNDKSNFCSQAQILKNQQLSGFTTCNVLASVDQLLVSQCGAPPSNQNNNNGLGNNSGSNNGGGGTSGSTPVGAPVEIYKGFICELEARSGNEVKYREVGPVWLAKGESRSLHNDKFLFITLSKLGKIKVKYHGSSLTGKSDMIELSVEGLNIGGYKNINAMTKGYAGADVKLNMVDDRGNNLYLGCKGTSQFKLATPKSGNTLCTGGSNVDGELHRIDSVIQPADLTQGKLTNLSPSVSLQQVDGQNVYTTVLDGYSGLTIESTASAQAESSTKSLIMTGKKDYSSNVSATCFKR